MQLSDWDDRWVTGRIGFHQSKVSDYLSKYRTEVWGDTAMSRVLVPLCGKSLDLVFLADHADAVVGVEFVDQAVKEFFDEQGLAATVNVDRPRVYQAAKYTMFAADFFEVTNKHMGTIDAVFDRASLVALDAETRIRYVQHLASIQEQGALTLLITFDYNQSQMNGPPFAVSDTEVNQLFADEFRVDHLETRQVLNEQFRKNGLTSMTESAFKLTRL